MFDWKGLGFCMNEFAADVEASESFPEPSAAMDLGDLPLFYYEKPEKDEWSCLKAGTLTGVGPTCLTGRWKAENAPF